MASTVKLTVNMPTMHVAELRRVAKRRGATMTEVLRHAINLGKLLDNIQRRGGAVFVEEPDGKRYQLLIP
jgi:hypothetical protein